MKLKNEILVLVLCRDRSRFIENCLNSIISQTVFENGIGVDVLISDNSSKEAEALSCRQIAERVLVKHNFKYIRQSGSLTMCEHSFKVFSEIPEQYAFVAIHNDDDIWMPKHLEYSIAAFKEDVELGCTISNGQIIDSEGNINGKTTNPVNWQLPEKKSDQINFWLTSWYGNFPSIVIKNSLLKLIPKIENQHIDTWMILWCLGSDFKVKCFTTPNYFYRIHLGSATNTGAGMLKERHKMRIWMAQKYFFRFSCRSLHFLPKVIRSIFIVYGK